MARGGPGDAGQPAVVEEDDPARAQQPAQVVQIDKDGIEAVVAIHNGQVEPARPCANSRGSAAWDSAA